MSKYIDLDIVGDMLKKGEKTGCICYKSHDCYKCLSLHYVILHNDIRVVKSLLKQPMVNINYTGGGNFAMTPLILTCYKGYKNIVKLLLQQDNIDVNIRIKDLYNLGVCGGKTALHVAIENKKFKCAKLLIESFRCDLSIKNESGETARDLAVSSGLTKIVVMIDNLNKHA